MNTEIFKIITENQENPTKEVHGYRLKIGDRECFIHEDHSNNTRVWYIISDLHTGAKVGDLNVGKFELWDKAIEQMKSSLIERGISLPLNS
jgi:hypothetical protein